MSNQEIRLFNSDECQPLKNMRELLSWKPHESDWSKLVKPLLSRSIHCYAGKDLKCHTKTTKPMKLLSSTVPKTLLCHDMKGGYLDDKFVKGTAYSYQYLFYHWSVVDIFVYFSHHFVTIPPVMWINAAHNHGVQILGTLITENTDGEEIWAEIFSNERWHEKVVDQLVAIKNRYCFDGYLINVENKIDRSSLPKLEKFLKDLKSKMRTSNGIVIWYDAVSFIDGNLAWKNELNEHNKSAFDVCDGIFLNYAWKLHNLQNSLSNAGIRLHDVYVGIDVFGRGCHGGGGFNTDAALSVIRSFGLSAAIFGHGWTHETQADDYQFFAIEKKFWVKLFSYLYIYCPNSVPFEANFNQGISIHPQIGNLWYDLSLQSLQLSLPSCSNEVETQSCKQVTRDHSFRGSGCLLLNVIEDETEIHNLMMCDFPSSSEKPLKFSVSAKLMEKFHPFQMILGVDNQGRYFNVILNISQDQESVLIENDYSCAVTLSNEINSSKIIQITSDSWILNTFFLNFNGLIIEIKARTEVKTIIGSFSFEYQ